LPLLNFRSPETFPESNNSIASSIFASGQLPLNGFLGVSFTAESDEIKPVLSFQAVDGF
jgi:hypothetical protein